MSKQRNNKLEVVVRERTPQQNNQKSKKKKAGRSRNRRKAQVTTRGPRMVASAATALSPCALDYMKAVVDPFGMKISGRLPCIPDLFDMPSYKLSTTCRTTFSTGSANFGYIIINPLTNDVTEPYGYGSSSAFTLTTTSAIGAANVVTFVDPRYPYGPAVGLNYRPMRVVAAAVRARYIGTVLNRGGRIATACLPYAPDINGLGITSLLGYPDVTLQQIDDKWHGCYFRASTPDDLVYYDAGAINAEDTTNQNRLVIMAESAAAAQPFEVEVVRFMEFLPGGGALSVPGVSRSDSDIQGMSWVRNILGSVSSSLSGPAAWNAALRASQAILPGLVGSMVPGGGTAARLLQYSQPTIEEL